MQESAVCLLVYRSPSMLDATLLLYCCTTYEVLLCTVRLCTISVCEVIHMRYFVRTSYSSKCVERNSSNNGSFHLWTVVQVPSKTEYRSFALSESSGPRSRTKGKRWLSPPEGCSPRDPPPRSPAAHAYLGRFRVQACTQINCVTRIQNC